MPDWLPVAVAWLGVSVAAVAVGFLPGYLIDRKRHRQHAAEQHALDQQSRARFQQRIQEARRQYPEAARLLTGHTGWYVPHGATHCYRCGDQNWDDTRMCLTCTHPDDPCSLRPWEMHSDAPARRRHG